MIAEPLPLNTRARLTTILDGLHPVAKRVLARTEGIWVAENIPGAAAAFLPCSLDQERSRGGFIVIDISQFPLDIDLRDADVPDFYWQSLGLSFQENPIPYSVKMIDEHAATPADHAVRYLILHELGHALSLLSGEFSVAPDGSTRLNQLDGFESLSWRIMTTESRYLPLAGTGPIVRAVVPRLALDTFQWGSILGALDHDTATLLAPGYDDSSRRPATVRANDVCMSLEKLPRAGFVTPTAARYPTEDFAEMFAHAILADEEKIRPSDKVAIDVPGCSIKSLPSPYFSTWLEPKRRYMETALQLPTGP